MTEEQHKWLLLTVRDLDAVIPNPEAAVQMMFDEESYTFTATQQGYLRLGVEMMKAATLTSGEKEEDGVLRLDWDLGRLMAPDNEVELGRFLMVDAIEPLPEPVFVAPAAPNPWRTRLAAVTAFLFSAMIVLALIVGAATIASFLLDMLH